MQRKLAEFPIFPRLLADVVAGGIRQLKRFAQRLRLRWSRKEFDLSNQPVPV